MNDTKAKFNLIENARDSLEHAVEHFTNKKNPTASDLKRAILDVNHVIELILKERIRRIHPAFIWRNVDKFPSIEALTIGAEAAISRLFKYERISISKESKQTLDVCRKVRNEIEHYEFSIDLKKARILVGRMLSFIFEFSRLHLDIDLESDYRKDKRWSALIDMFEFWDVHRDATEQRLMKERNDLDECPGCGAFTYSLDDSVCLFCEHSEDQVECDICGEMVWESDTDSIEEMDSDGHSVFKFTIISCFSCINKTEGAEAEADRLMDEWKEHKYHSEISSNKDE